jgi:regulator of cell morphogenesis and NO signaling
MDSNERSFQSALAERTLGEIAVAFPGATALLRDAKLDYCCGGQATLRQAAASKSLDLDDLVSQLGRLAESGAPAGPQQDTGALIDTIVTRYHRVHSRELPELIKLAKRVEAVHKEHPSVPAGLASLIEQILGDMTMHMQKEELILFPAMRKGGRASIGHPIAVMMAEHDDHGKQLQAIRDLTGDMTPPEDACMTWRALYAGLGKFADDLIDHVHIENNILFPRFLGGGAAGGMS